MGTSTAKYREVYFNENIELGVAATRFQKMMSKLTDSASAKIFRSVQKARSNPNYSTVVVQSNLLTEIDHILREFEADAIELLSDGVRLSSDIATRRSTSDCKAIGIESHMLDSNDALKVTEGIMANSEPFITIQVLRMFQSVKQIVKKEAVEISRKASIEGVSRAEATKLMFAKNSANQIPLYFTDKAGRRRSSGSYFELVIASVMRHAECDVYVAAAIENGHDLVLISDRGSSDSRKAWEGKVISLTGAEGRLSLSDVQTEGKIFQPNSRHSLLVYSEETSTFLKEPYAI